jgi:PEP-CTERM motif-containing protein
LRKYLAAAAAAAVLVGALPAAASTFLFETTPGSDGSISWVFGNSGGIPAGAFEDTFDILIPTTGTGDGGIQASFTSPTDDLLFTSVTFDGHTFTLDSVPGLNRGDLPPFLISPGGHYTLDVKGVSPGIDADYAGTLSFTPASVPEPTTWALLILGFGLSGAALRSRKLRAA